MFTLISLTTLYLLVLVGMMGICTGNRRDWPQAAQGLPATRGMTLATPWFRSVNWNGGDDKKSGGK